MRTTFAALALLLTAQLGVSAASLDLGHNAGSTPYDRYMRPVRQVLSSIGNDDPSMTRVKQLMREGRGFRYVFDDPYTAAYPSETEATRAGDCKDKALWLADRINDDSVRFVVGKAKANARLSHAWVLWKNEGRWWILDCTRNSRPIPADRVGRNEYVPYYSWAKGAVYRHSATRNQFADNDNRGRRSPVAARYSRR